MRLTNTIREEIVAAAIYKAFTARKKQLDEARTALGDALYSVYVGEHEAAMRKFGKGFFMRSEYIVITSEGFFYHTANGTHHRLRMSKERPFPYVVPSFEVDESHDLFSMAQAVVKFHDELITDRRQFKTDISQLLFSVSTTEKLLLVWPELEPLIPKALPKNVSVIPFELPLKLNQQLGFGGRAQE